jgi:hypothetical protein
MLERKPHHQRVAARGKDQRKTRRLNPAGLIAGRVKSQTFRFSDRLENRSLGRRRRVDVHKATRNPRLFFSRAEPGSGFVNPPSHGDRAAWASLVKSETERGEEMTEKWDDPQLDAAQFAIDRFLNAKQTVSEQMAEIYQSIRDGSATDEDRKRLKGLREQYIALSKEVEDVMGRLVVGKQLPHPKLV